MKKVIRLSGIVWMILMLTGCSEILKTESDRSDREYELLDIRDIPQDLRRAIEEQKAEPFEITYRDMKDLYIVKGYGKKEESGYCIEIAECTETENAIYIETILHGPGGEGAVCETEYPFCVIRTGYTEKHVILEE